MGAVYLVEDQTLFGKRWALKEFADTFTNPADRANAIKQFEQEARLLVSLTHVNLPHVADYFMEGGRQYLAMEYVDGDTLAVLLQASKGGLPESQVVDWAAQLCDVLEYLHNQKPKPIVFRDLKPANIMLTRAGQIKLIDFGIARLFDVAKRTDTLKMGTVGYAPPEQYAGHGQTDPRSDIYALGVTLHHLLTDRDPSTQPFVFPPCRQLKAVITPSVEAVVARAVELDPARRFQSAVELRKSLPGLPVQSAATIGGQASSQASASSAPTVPAVQISSTQMVVGPEDVKWTAMTLLKTFAAYCGQDRRETEWVIEGKGSRSCLECGRNVPLVGSGKHMQAWCSHCGRVTTHAWGGDKCACLGCGRVDALTDFRKQMRAPCSRCGRQTEWACGQKEVVCRGCGAALSVSTVKGLPDENSSYMDRRIWQIEGGIGGFCSKCGCKTPWLSWQVTYAPSWDRSICVPIRRCLWCGTER